MQLNKKFIIPVLVYSAFIFAIGYTVTTTYEPVTKLFTGMFLDSLDTLDMPIDPIGDVSQMFNERGFFKSNSTSFDESEIINDFNGNLMYQIPLYSFKGAGDVNLDVTLNYNGSVNHQIILAKKSTYITHGNYSTRYNVSSPEWIIAVNGIAVQTLNFESYLLTDPLSAPGELTGNNIHKLIPGYHFDDRLKSADYADKDRIYILMGDGSSITLVNKNPDYTEETAYIGDYYSDSKESHIKAKVYFAETGSINSYRNRYVELMMGDGLIYKFKEYKRDFDDLGTGEGIAYNRPQILLLEEIIDMFGNKINIVYGWLNLNSKARPLIQNIGVYKESIDFEYFVYFGQCLGIHIKNYTIGNYKIRFNEAISFMGPGNKVASIKEIINPLGQNVVVDYDQDYQRALINLPYHGGSFSTKNVRFGNMNRIRSFKNFLGGTRKYKYFGTNQLTLDYTQMSNNLIRSPGTVDFQGLGRDVFYTNMIDTLAVYNENNQQKTKQSFIYTFTDVNNDFQNKEIDTADYYATERQIISRDNGTVNTSESNFSRKEYRVYPVKTYGVRISEDIDLTAVTKLMNDLSLNTSGNVYHKTGYIYHLGGINGDVFTGSFKLMTRGDTTAGVGRQTNFIYEFKAADQNGNAFDSVITEKVEVDPNGYKTHMVLFNFENSVNFIKHGMEGNQSGTAPAFLTFEGFKTFYKIGVDTLVRRFSNNQNRYAKPHVSGYSDELLQQQTKTYILDTGNARGYFGQMITHRTFAYGSTSAFIQTDYDYYKRDTLARYLYSPSQFPKVEGNLKLTKMPDNREERYFYYLVNKVDTLGDWDVPIGTPPPPKVYFKVRYNNGNEEVRWESYRDTRLPIKVDSYLRTGPTSVDTLKKLYFSYNSRGNKVAIVDENEYLTTLDYDNTYNRIRKITLPGDYSTLLDKDTSWVVTVNFTSPVTTTATAAGYYDSTPGQNNLNYFATVSTTCMNRFTFKYDMDILSPNKFFPAMEVKVPYLGEYTSIDSAILSFAPQWYTLRSGGQTVQSGYKFTVKPISSSGSTGTGDCFQVQSPVIESNAVDANISGNLFRNYNTDISRDCEDYNTHNVRVESLLQSLINSSKTLLGFKIDYLVTDINLQEASDIQVRMPLTECANFDSGEWLDNYIPKLIIYGTQTTYDTIHSKIYYGGTYIYDYDDVNKTTTVKSRFNHSSSMTNFKQVKYHFDGFGNINEKDVYKSSTAFDEYEYKFNFMNQPAENIDGRNNSTKFSYDFLGRQKGTTNADNSSSANAFAYDNNLGSYFGGTYSGFVEKQTFTDETNRTFNKYFDAVGNLLREEKFVAATGGGDPSYDDNPYDPDTTFSGQDFPANFAALTTDYRYDKLYRLVEVKTPGGKPINYFYDGYGRQSQRNTPDAGTTRYSYDKNSNLILSQDARQYSISAVLNTRRYYDGLNRLLSISDLKLSELPTGSGPMGDTLLPFEFDNPPSADSMYVVNVYDTVTNTTVGIFGSMHPSDYGALPNYTRGKLAVTAYRTRLTDAWGFKFYRYDERGNVSKLWHYIAGLGWKSEMYYYNSQNQLTRNRYQPGGGDEKLFTYGYDDAGRLDYVNQYIGSQPEDPEIETDVPGAYFTLTKYTYNENSQIATHKLNDNSLTTTNTYNNRNWLNWTNQNPGTIFRYVALYNENGNIRYLDYQGSYANNFSSTGTKRFVYIYDNSNRLLKQNEILAADSNSFDLINGYDKDGNLVGMKRYGSSNNLADDFTYNYYSGTNKLQSVFGSKAQYTYDANGNMTKDEVNKNYNILYDHRNLITDIRTIRQEIGIGGPEDKTYWTIYKYDEAGNRIRKITYKYNGSEPDPEFDENGDNPSWELVTNEFYVRDVSGKEIAIYNGSSLTQWNIWGLDNVGKINADTTRNYYLKDHLGSIRVVLNSTNTVISAQDYDAWGYQLENRTYNSSAMKYDFTGKERDDETSYDYFGARYYDSRIANWTSIDPLFEKHYDFSPYNYVIRNPIMFVDPIGLQIRFSPNIDTRQTQLKQLRNTLPEAFSSFIGATVNNNGEFVMDIRLLESATVFANTKFYPIEFQRLLTIGKSSDITQFFGINEQKDYRAYIAGTKDLAYGHLGYNLNEEDEIVFIEGMTIVSGNNMQNPEAPLNISTSGINEVYYLNTLSEKEIAIILGHELYGHVFNYLTNSKWRHKPYNKEFEDEIQQIETNIKNLP